MAGWDDLGEPAGEITPAYNYNAEYFNTFLSAIIEKIYVRSNTLFDFDDNKLEEGLYGNKALRDKLVYIITRYSQELLSTSRWIREEIFDDPVFKWSDKTTAEVYYQTDDFEGVILDENDDPDPDTFAVIQFPASATLSDLLSVRVWNGIYELYKFCRYFDKIGQPRSTNLRPINGNIYSGVNSTNGSTFTYTPPADELIFNDSCNPAVNGDCPGTDTGTGRTYDDFMQQWIATGVTGPFIDGSIHPIGQSTYNFWEGNQAFLGFGADTDEIFRGQDIIQEAGGRETSGHTYLAISYLPDDEDFENPISMPISFVGEVSANHRTEDLLWRTYIDIAPWPPTDGRASGSYGEKLSYPLDNNYNKRAPTDATPLDPDKDLIPLTRTSVTTEDPEGNLVTGSMFKSSVALPKLVDFEVINRTWTVADLPFAAYSAARELADVGYDPDDDFVSPDQLNKVSARFQVSAYEDNNEDSHFYIDMNADGLEFNPW